MASIVNVSLSIDPDSIWAMSDSLSSLAFCLTSGLFVGNPYSDRLALLADEVDICRFQDSVGPAPVAEIVHSITVAPSDGYLSLVSAIVSDGNADARIIDHGWPVLFLRGVSASSTIAEGGAVTSPVLNSRDRTAGGR